MLNFGLVGSSLKHSKSKIIHEYIFNDKNIDATYEIFETNNIDEFINFAINNLNGFNVTFPYKEEIINYCHFVDSNATSIGAVNTVVIKNNKLYGYNTDIDGVGYYFENVLDLESNKNILLLGYGGAGKATKAYLENTAHNLTISNRTLNKVDYSEKISISDANDRLSEYDIIINSTSVGYNNDVIINNKFTSNQIVIDLNYNNYYTQFLKNAINAKCFVKNGLDMLIVQAIKAQQLWNNVLFDNLDETVFNIKLILIDRVILIDGFMGSGKSSIINNSQYYADLDEKIISKYGNISSYFQKNGEKEFRKVELVEFQYAVDKYKIISLGGGFSYNNKELLTLNSDKFIVINIEREFEEIEKTLKNDLSRPLNKEIYQLYLKRKENYKELSSITLKNNSTLKSLKEKFMRYL